MEILGDNDSVQECVFFSPRFHRESWFLQNRISVVKIRDWAYIASPYMPLITPCMNARQDRSCYISFLLWSTRGWWPGRRDFSTVQGAFSLGSQGSRLLYCKEEDDKAREKVPGLTKLETLPFLAGPRRSLPTRGARRRHTKFFIHRVQYKATILYYTRGSTR